MNEQTVHWRKDVIALIPALRAFAWSLSHNAANADDLVQETLTKAWANRAQDLPFKTPREAIILASIVEKETRLPEERPHVGASPVSSSEAEEDAEA